MKECPKKYKEVCENFIREYFAARRRQIENNFLTHLPGEVQRLVLRQPLETVLGHRVVEIARAAAGELDAGDELGRAMVAEAIQRLLEDLFAPPGLAYAYAVPSGFWNETPFGWMVRDAHFWATGDEMITQTEAADMAGVGLKTVGERVSKGLLTPYIDLSEPNPRRARRVSRQEIEAWIEKRGSNE